MRAGADETYIISGDQWDRGAAMRLINALRIGGIEVERATGGFPAGGRHYPAGTFLIRGSQPFLPYLRDLLAPQHYPDRRSAIDGTQPGPTTSRWTMNLKWASDRHGAGQNRRNGHQGGMQPVSGGI